MLSAIVVRKAEHPYATDKIPNVAELEMLPEAFLGNSPVTIDVAYSSLNYKDALALTGRPGVVRITPIIAGVDLVGTVRSSQDPKWKPGDKVVLNGSGIAETQHGGLTTLAKVEGTHLIRVPQGFSLQQSAALGTAGFTAALSVMRLLETAIKPGDPILVTGASGGVGSIAIMLLANMGHHPIALSGRGTQHGDLLRSLGATDIIDRTELSGSQKPLQQERWAGVIDAVGGEILSNAIAQTRYGGTVTCCGNAASPKLPASVFPFILRGVTLAGIDSVQVTYQRRVQAWHCLTRFIDTSLLDALTSVIRLQDAIPTASALLNGQTHGRIVVQTKP